MNLDQTTKDALVECKNQVPKNYRELIDDLNTAENIRSKETAFQGEKTKLQSLFGHRFIEFETNWQEITNALEWTKEFKAMLGYQSIPDPIVDIVTQGSAPDNNAVKRVIRRANITKKYFRIQF